MAQKELIEKPMEFFEKASVIGDDEKKSEDLTETQKRETLDQILERVTGSAENFRLIKNGSRQRALSIDKISYVKAAVNQGYTLKEIGENISISATAVNRMSLSKLEVLNDNGEKNVKKGEVITESNVRSIRPNYGLSPKYYNDIIGKSVNRDLKRGIPLEWKYIE